MKRISASPGQRRTVLIGETIFGIIPLLYAIVSHFMGKQIPTLGFFFAFFFAFCVPWLANGVDSGKADEVFDCDDHLLIKIGGESKKIVFSDITSVRFRYARPPFLSYIELIVKNDAVLGETIKFFVSMAFLGSIGDHPITKSLRERITPSTASIPKII